MRQVPMSAPPIVAYHPTTKKPYVKLGNTVFALVEPGEPGERFRCYLDNVLYDIIELFQSEAETEQQLVLDIVKHTTQLEHICACNKCGNRIIDENPEPDAPKLMPDGTELNMIQIEDQHGYFWACPVCLTDAYLKDIEK